MTITIDLPEGTVANLNERVQAQGRPAAEIVAEVVTERFGIEHDADGFPLDDAAVEKIRRGFPWRLATEMATDEQRCG